MEKRNVPKLRFKGFEDEWKEYKFGDITKKTGAKNKENKTYDVYSISNKHGFIPQNKQFEGSRLEGLAKSDYKIVNKGEFAYNPARINVGSIGLLEEDKIVIVSSLYVCFKMLNDIYPKFFVNYFDTYKFNKDVLRNVEGGVREYLFYENFSNIKAIIPSFKEQTKIANFLSNVDNIIEEQEGKVKDLEQYKKGMMQKIFKQEVRFRDDNGGEYPEWEEKKLSQITDVLSGKRLPKGETLTTIDTGIKYITVSDMGSKYVSKENIRYITKEIEEQIKKYKVNFGDIIISVAGTLGKINIIDKKISGSNLTENCDKITSFKDCINIYIYYYLNTSLIQNQISSVNTISSQPKLALDRIRKFNVLLPCIEEQTKIANFLSNIDNIIEEENKKLEDLKLWKKGLLQQMFV